MKVQLPWIGKAAGSSAGVIYQTYWGNTYSRSFPASFHYPDTPSQQATQAKFFDLMRNWLPIYGLISTTIDPSQRHNLNPYNQFLKGLYKVANPYNKPLLARPPRYFGLDDLNRVVCPISNVSITDVKISWEVHFDYNTPTIQVDREMIYSNFLLVNRTRQSLYFRRLWYVPQAHYVGFENPNDWELDDELYLYLALSGYSWLGNFNLCPI